jgi:acyl-coenzyme A synthetase/AMP-(fatty) acid ligase
MILDHSLANLASRFPLRIAVIQEGGSVSFAALESRVRRMAGWLWREGLRAGDMVGLSVGDACNHLAACLALIRIGCHQVALPSHEPDGMRLALATRCRVGCVIGSDAGVVPSGLCGLAPVFDEIFSDSALEKAAPVPSGPEPFVFLPSSGTTGRCKIVRRTPGQLVGYGLSDLPEPSVILGPASIESNVGKWSHLANLARGRTLVLGSGRGASLAETCRRHGVTLVNLAPSGAVALLGEADSEHSCPAFGGVRFSVGGAPVSGPLRREIFVLYGATECGNATCAGPGLHAAHPDSAGYPLPGVEVEVVDEGGRPLPPGETGWVRIRSRVSATGYFDDEEASARAFRDGWFHPGDMGRMTPDGVLLFCGRGDDMMVLNTINIFPAEIEAVAESFPGVRDCAAFALPSAAYGDIPVLALVAETGCDVHALLAHCRGQLGTRAPRTIFQVDSVPRNAAGKVVRRELRALFESRR